MPEVIDGVTWCDCGDECEPGKLQCEFCLWWDEEMARMKQKTGRGDRS